MLPIRTILCPTDFSEPASAAFEFACALARDYGAALVVAHVTEPPLEAAADGMMVYFPAQSDEDVTARLEAVRPGDPSIRVSHRQAFGDAGAEILALAKDAHADLIVLGTHGRTGLTRLLTGSVAEDVLRRASCPVITVRTPFPPQPSGPPLPLGEDR